MFPTKPTLVKIITDNTLAVDLEDLPTRFLVNQIEDRNLGVPNIADGLLFQPRPIIANYTGVVTDGSDTLSLQGTSEEQSVKGYRYSTSHSGHSDRRWTVSDNGQGDIMSLQSSLYTPNNATQWVFWQFVSYSLNESAGRAIHTLVIKGRSWLPLSDFDWGGKKTRKDRIFCRWSAFHGANEIYTLDTTGTDLAEVVVRRTFVADTAVHGASEEFDAGLSPLPLPKLESGASMLPTQIQFWTRKGIWELIAWEEEDKNFAELRYNEDALADSHTESPTYGLNYVEYWRGEIPAFWDLLDSDVWPIDLALPNENLLTKPPGICFINSGRRFQMIRPYGMSTVFWGNRIDALNDHLPTNDEPDQVSTGTPLSHKLNLMALTLPTDASSLVTADPPFAVPATLQLISISKTPATTVYGDSDMTAVSSYIDGRITHTFAAKELPEQVIFTRHRITFSHDGRKYEIANLTWSSQSGFWIITATSS